jgi:hypothetical protein
MADDRRGPRVRPDSVPNAWALVSLLCSLGFFCPAGPVLGLFLGLRALARYRAEPARAGRGYAVAGVVIGGVGAGLWVATALWWNVHVRRPLLEGPAPQLTAGLSGDVVAFKAGFHGPGAEAPDDQVREFLANLRQRYGRFIGATQDRGVAEDRPFDPGHPRVDYILHFDGGEVAVEARFVLVARGLRGPVLKLARLAVRDDARGGLVYPSEPVGEPGPERRDGG